MNSGILLADDARLAVRLERHLPDPPSIVWLAITDREQLRSWVPCDVIVAGGQWKVGATITFRFPAEVIDITLTGEVLAVDEPNALAFSWGDEILRFELSPADGGTNLVLVDELSANIAARNAAGWEVCLDRLAGLDPPPEAWPPRLDRGGNRQLNRALRIIAITHGRLNPETRAYLQRKEAEGKSRMEAMLARWQLGREAYALTRQCMRKATTTRGRVRSSCMSQSDLMRADRRIKRGGL